ncbi:macrocin O-methyltransferase [Candidatus Pelagibacter sp.]|nr:macrocin O-methyltransferase [Candidatus Pelagibacter sp.]
MLKKIAKRILLIESGNLIDDYNLEYLLWISNIYSKIKNIPGHIAEIGVADGRNTILFGRLIKLHRDQSVRQYIGFDTFDGFTDRDLARDAHLDKVNWKDNSRKRVLKRCFDNDVEDLVEIFEGDASKLVPHILKNHIGKKFQKGKAKFALLYIDCNAYIPAIDSMESFLPYMIPGGFIVIDEKNQGGETEAVIEFAKKHSFKIERLGPNEIPLSIQIPNN